MPLALLFLNRPARNIHCDRTVHLHHHMFLDDIQHLHPPRNSGIGVHGQNPRRYICLQARIRHERIGNDLNSHVHSHGSSGLGLARRPASFSDDCAVVEEGGGGVSVPEGSEVGVLDGDVGGQGHVDAGARGGAVDEFELVDGDAVEFDDWVFDSEDGEDEDDDDDGLDEDDGGDAAAALDAFAAAAAMKVVGNLIVVAAEAVTGRS